jgi:hypothetical protein
MLERFSVSPRRTPAVTFALVAGAAGLVAGVWYAVPQQVGDPDFVATVANPAWSTTHPVVLIDEAHYNVHRMSGRYRPFAELARQDGFTVAANREPFTAASLAPASALVVANALGVRGALQQLANIFRLEGKLDVVKSAFTLEETEAVVAWVHGGGSLLLVADHAPCGAAARALSRRFGVEMTDWYAEDETFHEPETDTPSFLVFSRENGLLLDHPVTRGRGELERIGKVVTFTGQSLKAPVGATPFLRLSAGAVEYPRRRSAANEARSAAGLAQGVALEFGRGRVVVLGEAALATSQLVKIPGWRTFHFGMGWVGYDNRQLVLNILHWLTHVIN